MDQFCPVPCRLPKTCRVRRIPPQLGNAADLVVQVARLNISLKRPDSPHRTGLNSVLLHRGHLPAASNATGLVKCFTYRQCLHFHLIERCSCDCSIWFNAFVAVSRIASRAAFSLVSAGSIDSTPIVEVWRSTCAILAPKDAVKLLSCSH